MRSRRLNWIKDLLWLVVFAGLVATLLRFGWGLGAATGLNDATPWGLWIAFKLGFVALAGGGFTLAGLVYVFHLDTFRPALRRAILLALLGYGSFIISLLFDLGLPWHIYMPIIHWQEHSVMFEIAWCVLLYFSVLTMEFGPVILEHPRFRQPLFQEILRLLHKAVPSLVIAGIVLSTLHQSSLGSLFLIMPHRVHPLWYSPWIPVLFFISSIAAGLMALIVEIFLAERLFGSDLHFYLLEQLGKIGGLALWIYLLLRLGDLTLRGVLPSTLVGTWQSLLFGIEILIGGFLPATLLLAPKVRRSHAGLLTCALLTIGGVLSQRMSLSLFTMWRPEGNPYVPSGFEIIIAFAIPAAAGLIYLFFVEHLSVFDGAMPERTRSPKCPQFDLSGLIFQHQDWQSQVARRSGMAVIVIALAVASLPAGQASGRTMPASPAQAALGWDPLKIDGDRDGIAVVFPHLEHQERLAEALKSSTSACQVCHHLNKPGDEATSCWECHRDNYSAQSIFDHTLHIRVLGGNPACTECHQEEHRVDTAVDCKECHEGLAPLPSETRFNYIALSYPGSLHGKCLTCHEEQAIILEEPELAGCSTCHFKEIEDSGIVD